MDIRSAEPADLPEIQSIYAHHVLRGTGSFEEVPPSVETMEERRRAGLANGATWLVAEDESGVVGYAYYGRFHVRPAYRFTVEDSVYVREDVRGQGVGKALIGGLVEAATGAGMRQMIAVIGDAENGGSIGLHASLGFRQSGVLRAVGLKFGRWLDVVYMQRPLGSDTDTPEAIR